MNSLQENLTDAVQQVANHEILGNTPVRWGAAAAVAVGAFLLLHLIRAVAVSRLGKHARSTKTDLDDLFVDLVRRTNSLFLGAVALYAGSAVLDLTPAISLTVQHVFAIALFLQVGVWVNYLMMFLVQRYVAHKSADHPSGLAMVGLLTFVGQIGVWSLVVLLTLDNLGFDVTALIAGLGVGGVAIALALQNVLGDTLASLSIILDKPFEIGDFIVVGELTGTVERIGIKTTRVRSLSGEQLIFGNHDLLSSRVRNYKRMYERRIVFAFGVTYQTEPDELERIPALVREIVESIADTRFDRAHFKQFGDSSLDFEVVYYVTVPDYNRYMDVQQAINIGLYRRLSERGVDFAYPSRTLFLRNDVEPLRAAVVGVDGEAATASGSAAAGSRPH
jgi:small-conductance mechanosensitive channel